MNQSASERIVTKIADETGTDVTNLPALYDTVDPTKLDALVRSLDDGSLSFTYAGFEITVTSEADVTITDRSSVTQS